MVELEIAEAAIEVIGARVIRRPGKDQVVIGVTDRLLLWGGIVCPAVIDPVRVVARTRAEGVPNQLLVVASQVKSVAGAWGVQMRPTTIAPHTPVRRRARFRGIALVLFRTRTLVQRVPRGPRQREAGIGHPRNPSAGRR